MRLPHQAFMVLPERPLGSAAGFHGLVLATCDMGITVSWTGWGSTSIPRIVHCIEKAQ